MPRPNRIAGVALALSVMGAAFAAGAMPPRVIAVADWAAEKRILAAESGSPLAGKWSNDLAPYLVEPMNCLSLSHPARDVTLMASAQIGKTECGINAIGSWIDTSPAPILVVLPTLDEGKKYVKVKLQPTIDATPALKSKIREQKSRDEDGSTTAFKKFRGGFLQVTGANSSKGLQMISVRALLLEEISEFPFDVDNRGDPVDLAEKRLTSWSGREKIFRVSTPGIKGMCRITAAYEKSDQRRFHVSCPQCAAEQTLEWKHLKFDVGAPEKAFYVCVNGCPIEHHHKAAMLATGRWIAGKPGEGRQPGFAINQLYSPFVTWGDTARAFLAAKDNPSKLKVFTQQVLGEAWEEKGEAPDHEKLLTRREAWKQALIPPGGLFLVGSADVQKNRIEWTVWAFGIGLTSWLVDKGVIEGDPNEPAIWTALEKIVGRRYLDTRGNAWPIDAFGVDTGYLTSRVYAFAARHAGTGRVFALDGMPGWKRPPLGTPLSRDVDFEGRKIGAVLKWPVGTWDMKSEVYWSLGRTIKGPDQATGIWPTGALHLPDWVDADWLKQLTAEHLASAQGRSGVTELHWVRNSKDQANEAHDLAVYARALAHHLSDALSAEEWGDLAARRGEDRQKAQLDLAALWTPGLADAPTPEQPGAATAAAPAPAEAPAASRRRGAIRSPFMGG